LVRTNRIRSTHDTVATAPPASPSPLAKGIPRRVGQNSTAAVPYSRAVPPHLQVITRLREQPGPAAVLDNQAIRRVAWPPSA
jgi:hypothetical protein